MAKYNETDFLHISARLKSKEAKLSSSDSLKKMAAMKPEAAMDILRSTLVFNESEGKVSPFEYEKILTAELNGMYSFISSLIPDKIFCDIFRYQYDFMNIKALIKADFLHVSPDSMLFSSGTLDNIKQLYREKDPKALDGYFLKAVTDASKGITDHADPQRVDIITDRLYYEYTRKKADETGCDFLSEYLRKKTDIRNIITRIRIGLSDIPVSFFEEVYLPSSGLKKDYFTGSDNLTEMFAHSGYEKMIPEDIADLTQLEKNADSLLNEEVRKMSRSPFGAPVVCAYILEKENEIKNERIIMSGVISGDTPDRIIRRLRINE